ncbi:fructoselysine 6-kinase [Virgibacillus sp. JSM 102003]|uniref:fructoselysine 6-kinase n=1 Tax=Virgibacillus sp. JSM 102003 TaxID=1562108 RepID=UPI0035C0E1A7
MRIAAVGDNCIDYYKGIKKIYSGGNAVNVAVYSARIGTQASYIGIIGTDAFGDKIYHDIKEKGVDVSHLHVSEGNTAVTYVELNNNDREFVGFNEGVMKNFNLTDEDIKFIAEHDIVHSGISGHCEKYFKIFKQRGLITSFDFSDEDKEELVDRLAPHLDYAFFSYVKDNPYIRSYLKSVVDRGSKIAVSTLGGNGSLAYDGKKYYKSKAKDIDVIDTMGAGDSFIAGFLNGIYQGGTIKVCMEKGGDTAAETIQYNGAW